MAIVTGPLFSIDASGQFAKSLVFGKWKGINTVRRYATPGGDTTARQAFVRDTFSKAVDMYHSLSGKDQEAWNRRALGTPMSGYNLFIRSVMSNLTAGVNRYNVISRVETTKLMANSATFEVQISEPAYFEILWDEEGKTLRNDIFITPDQVSGSSGNYSFTFTLVGLEPAKSYEFRIVQEPILIVPPSEVELEVVGEEGDAHYEFLISTISGKGEEIMDTSLIHDIENGPDEPDLTNRVEITWEEVLGARGYRVYLINRDEDEAYLISRTTNTSFFYRGLEIDEPEETIELAPDWHYPQDIRPIKYIVGESGNYHFTAAS